MKRNTNTKAMGLALCLSILQLFNTLPAHAADASSSSVDLSNVKINVSKTSSATPEQIKKLRPENQQSTIQSGSTGGQVSVDSVAGGIHGGGGDICEYRIKTIRDDLISWIISGGANELKLGQGQTPESYSNAMLTHLKSAKVRCVSSGDQGYPVRVLDTPKVCRFDYNQPTNLVTCDFNKFQNLSEADQYILIHHEFAGLANFEIPNGDISTYQISSRFQNI